ncbi:MAG: hypothetical protein RL272_1253 [Candidatus Parcubacteria bacterium]|jgi:hypothetical protein
MSKLIAAILIIASLGGASYAAFMGSMSMDHGMAGMMRADCGGAACAAADAPAAPDFDCLDHCLRTAGLPAIPAAPAIANFLIAIALLSITCMRLLGRPFSPNGAPPYVGPSLRTSALAGVIMRN